MSSFFVQLVPQNLKEFIRPIGPSENEGEEGDNIMPLQPVKYERPARGGRVP